MVRIGFSAEFRHHFPIDYNESACNKVLCPPAGRDSRSRDYFLQTLHGHKA